MSAVRTTVSGACNQDRRKTMKFMMLVCVDGAGFEAEEAAEEARRRSGPG
jgi:hypothetical protein